MLLRELQPCCCAYPSFLGFALCSRQRRQTRLRALLSQRQVHVKQDSPPTIRKLIRVQKPPTPAILKQIYTGGITEINNNSKKVFN